MRHLGSHHQGVSLPLNHGDLYLSVESARVNELFVRTKLLVDQGYIFVNFVTHRSTLPLVQSFRLHMPEQAVSTKDENWECARGRKESKRKRLQ